MAFSERVFRPDGGFGNMAGFFASAASDANMAAIVINLLGRSSLGSVTFEASGNPSKLMFRQVLLSPPLGGCIGP